MGENEQKWERTSRDGGGRAEVRENEQRRGRAKAWASQRSETSNDIHERMQAVAYILRLYQASCPL